MTGNVEIRPALSRRRREKWDKAAWIFILPYFIFLSIFTLYPTFMAIIGSLYKWDILTNKLTTFFGISNYIKALSDRSFLQSITNSFVYFILQIPTSIFGGMLVANLLNKKIKMRAFFRVVYFLPIATGSVVLAIVWSWMFQRTNGILNYGLELFGLPSVAWLSNQKVVMPAISLMKAWMDIGYYTIVFLGAFQSISNDLVEAAYIDGANARQTFWRVKFPLLNPTIIFCIMMATIWAFQLFNEPYLMTGGGPLGASTTMTLYLYENAFTKHRMSYASAIGVIIAAMIMLISLIERRLFERDIE